MSEEKSSPRSSRKLPMKLYAIRDVVSGNSRRKGLFLAERELLRRLDLLARQDPSALAVVVFDIDGTAVIPDHAPQRMQVACPEVLEFYLRLREAARVGGHQHRLLVQWVTARDGSTERRVYATIMQLKALGYLRDPRERISFLRHDLLPAGPDLTWAIAHGKARMRSALLGRSAKGLGVGGRAAMLLSIGNEWTDFIANSPGTLERLYCDPRLSGEDGCSFLLTEVPLEDPFWFCALKI